MQPKIFTERRQGEAGGPWFSSAAAASAQGQEKGAASRSAVVGLSHVCSSTHPQRANAPPAGAASEAMSTCSATVLSRNSRLHARQRTGTPLSHTAAPGPPCFNPRQQAAAGRQAVFCTAGSLTCASPVSAQQRRGRWPPQCHAPAQRQHSFRCRRSRWWSCTTSACLCALPALSQSPSPQGRPACRQPEAGLSVLQALAACLADSCSAAGQEAQHVQVKVRQHGQSQWQCGRQRGACVSAHDWEQQQGRSLARLQAEGCLRVSAQLGGPRQAKTCAWR